MNARALAHVAWLLVPIAGCEGPPPPLDASADAPAIDLCVVDEDCSDELFCTGIERCQPGSADADRRGCVTEVASPCLAGQSCDEAMGRCLTECDLSADADGDGAGATECGGADCDDADARRFPGNPEICDAADHDEDCDPSTYGSRDADRDTIDDASCCNVDAAGARTCGADCEDTVASVRPGGTEACNGLDDDCDGSSDEGILISGFADEDGDLHGDPAAPLDACPGASRFSTQGDDCDDANNRVHAAQVEICDAIDNDCDDRIDEHTRAVTWYRDADGDRFGTAASGTLIDCEPPAGYELVPFDCDDERAGVSPLADEACNGRDDDCNGAADYAIGPGDREDDDDDGAIDAACGGLGTDCDDRDATVRPGAEGVCDGRDHDCDGAIDDGVEVDWFLDEDGDGWGAGAAIRACAPPPGRVRRDGDCDDSLAGRSPSARDDCDGLDDDCDGMIDEGATRLAFYPDGDDDGSGGGTPVLACAAPAGHSLFPSDCDDDDPRRYEGAIERCDLVDNDCDGTPDESAEVVCDVAGASATCSAGTCVISGCSAGRENCDGMAANGCEIDSRSDPDHCGSCTTVCAEGPSSSATCTAGVCGLACSGTALDCDGDPSTGCEASIESDPANCGMCGRRCAPRAQASATCAAGVCGVACDPGWTDCDAAIATGCEVHTSEDPANCGGCGTACPLSSDACVRGSCVEIPFASTETVMDFIPGSNITLPAGVHHYRNIRINTGVIVFVTGDGVLDLRASGDVTIAGTIQLSGGAGGDYTGACGCGCWGGGGATAMVNYVTRQCFGGIGGDGARGGDGSITCSAGGSFGGGAAAGGAPGSGGGGGGYAGGGGGGATGGAGGGVPGVSSGGGPEQGGEPGLAIYGGADGCGTNAGGSGSIGRDAAADLAVATTFRPGSGGGGGAHGTSCGGGGGGGGGGGALRIASATRISITATGQLRVDGGRGGTGGSPGGGGSGGVIYLAAPAIENRGFVTARGGSAGAPCGGRGGLGRIRLSVLPERCVPFGTWDPPMPGAGCVRTAPAIPGRVYIDDYPF